MKQLDSIVFNNKKFSDLLEEIYTNQKSKQSQIITLIQELKPLIQDIGDASLVVPLIKDYMDLGLKNDEQLIKMATILQRVFNSNSSSGGDLALTDAEREQLLSTVKNLKIGK